MQLRPRLTSALGSPCFAMTRLSFTATDTPQPVPQNRQGALDHLTFASPLPWATTGIEIPAVAPAAAAAEFLMKSRLSIRQLLIHYCQPVGALVHERGR